MRLLLSAILGFLLLLIWQRKQKETTTQNVAQAESTGTTSAALSKPSIGTTDVVALSETEPQGRPAVDNLEALSGKPIVHSAWTDPEAEQVWTKDGVDRRILWQSALIQ